MTKLLLYLTIDIILLVGLTWLATTLIMDSLPKDRVPVVEVQMQ